MPRVHRIGDCNAASGCVTSTPQGSVYANNILISVDGAAVSADAACSDNNIHCHPNTANGGPTVFAENIPVNSAGDPDTCGHTRIQGSPNVFTDGGGGGAVFDNSEPLTGSPIFTLNDGRQVVHTEQDQYVFENTDVPEEINPGPEAVFPSTEVKPVTEQEQDPTQHPPSTPPPQDCSSVDSLPANFNWATVGSPPIYSTFDDFAQAFQLSTHYNLYDLTIGPAASTHRFTSNVIQASGLSQKEILQNLCFLAKTVLEPIRSRYGDFTITSGFRNRSGGSQHNKGQAVDLQNFSFHGVSNTGQLYYQRAQDIRDNIEYDQLILEWFGRNPWIHISSNKSGHRHSVLTQVSSSSYAPGLRRLG